MHSAQIQTVLAAAIGNRRRVWVRHADNAGQSSVRLVEPIALSGGIFQALDVGNGQQRSLQYPGWSGQSARDRADRQVTAGGGTRMERR